MDKLIIRRLIAGILLFVFAIIAWQESYRVAAYAGTLYIPKSAQGAGGTGLILAILAGIIGVIYAVTCNKRPVKWLEWAICIVAIIITLLAATENTKYYPDLNLFRWSFIILVILGLPLKKGFKDMPFEEKKDAKNIEENTNNNSSNVITEPLVNNTNDPIRPEKNSDINDLRDLKKLLDEGIITQDDFDTKKKQILKL
ncbi:SHOCT domain-containing protein [Liquorilactobacillus hordei]|uniref:SHOCT domain-containing protein n=1 Tax=Liquorilactobacillus hordei TaxID=468911 RepID=UPI0039E74D36